MATIQGFWSYVHKDDEAEQHRITKLARDVVAQYEILTGDTIDLFLDRDALEWGDNWRSKVDASLASIAFFVPVMTPRYFMSAECRRELRTFAHRASQLGIKELVLPLHYVNVPALAEDSKNDELIGLMQAFQWEDWRDLRFADVGTERYRRAVAGLASRLVAANSQAENTDLTSAALRIEPILSLSEWKGHIDRMGDALPNLRGTINLITAEITVVGALSRTATSEINTTLATEPGHELVRFNTAAQHLAKELTKPAETISALANLYLSQLDEIDSDFRIVIRDLPAFTEREPQLKPNARNFVESFRGLSASAHAALDAIQGMIDAIAPLERNSRDLRPVLRRLRQGLTVFIEGREVTDYWAKLIDESGVL